MMPRLAHVGTALLFCIPTLPAAAQPPKPNSPAEAALNGVILQKSFGDYEFQKRDIVTVANNPKVPGLGGLAFVKYRNPKGGTVELSIVWFEDPAKLRAFHESQLQSQRKAKRGLQQSKIGDHTVWANGKQAYYWTDGMSFTVGGGGRDVPLELVKAYLEVIPSREPAGPKAGAPADDDAS